MSATLLALNPSKTEFMIFSNTQQLSKFRNPQLVLDSNTTVIPVKKSRNLGFLFDSNLNFDNQITALSQSCFYHIHDLRSIHNTFDFSTSKLLLLW